MENLERQFTYSQTYNWTAIGLSAIRKSMDDLKFNEIVPAILSRELEPGAFHSYAVIGDKLRPEVTKYSSGNIESQVQVVGKEAYFLPVSHNFEKQQSVEFLNQVYCLAPCLRLLQEGENLSKKHLNTFFQIEVEWETQSMKDVFNMAERILVKIAEYSLSQIKDSKLEISEKSQKHLSSMVLGNYPCITFAEALTKVGANPNRTTDLTLEEDKLLSSQFDRPFWIYDYPKGVRDAVYHENKNGNYDTYDLMLPFGYGEISTGGIRPNSGEAIYEQSIDNLGEPIETLTHGHAEWKKRTKIQTAGFGIGFERLLRFLSGSETVLDFVQAHDHGPNSEIQSSIKLEQNIVCHKKAS